MNTREKLLASIEDARVDLVKALERCKVMKGITAAYPQETYARGTEMAKAQGRLEGLREALDILDGRQ